MIYGYARVSTQEQELGRQLDILNKMGAELIIEEKESGKNIDDRPKFKALLELLQEGDTLIVESISRLSRSVYDFLTVIRELDSKGVTVISAKENIDTSTPAGRFMMNVFASLYQMEREMMKERQAEGIANAQLRGVNFGRPRKEIDEDLFEELVEKNMMGIITGEKASAELDISLSTFNRRKKEYIESKISDE